MNNHSIELTAVVNFSSLKNKYYAMRHGHSVANAEGIIVSDPENGVEGYGLSESGQDQVDASADAMASYTGAGPDRLLGIVSSDFRRARETAETVFRRLEHARPVQLDMRLRERFFGDLEGQSDSLYDLVWQEDRNTPGHSTHNAESLDSVVRRATSLIAELEQTYCDCPVLLVAHGDILQILQCAFLEMDPGCHRSLDHLANAEVRLLNQS